MSPHSKARQISSFDALRISFSLQPVFQHFSHISGMSYSFRGFGAFCTFTVSSVRALPALVLFLYDAIDRAHIGEGELFHGFVFR